MQGTDASDRQNGEHMSAIVIAAMLSAAAVAIAFRACQAAERYFMHASHVAKAELVLTQTKTAVENMDARIDAMVKRTDAVVGQTNENTNKIALLRGRIAPGATG